MPAPTRHHDRFSRDDKVVLVVGGTGRTRGIDLAIANDLADDGVRSCVAGRSSNKRQAALAQLGTKRRQARGLQTDTGHFEELDEQAGVAAYLASPPATCVTGEAIRVDGGFLAAGV